MHWADLLIHPAAILAAANLLCRIPKGLSPAHRHRLILAGFALLMIWPLLSTVVPPIALPLWLTKRGDASVTVQQITFIPRTQTTAPHALNWPVIIWITGALLALLPVVLSYFHMLRISRRSIRLNDNTANSLLRELCAELGIRKTPGLLTVREPIVPLTFGLRQPKILLPVDYPNWSTLRQRTVLLHELAHVQRRDVLSQIAANLITAVWWFQPLCWINRRSLRRESEGACDALVLAYGVRPSDYAAQLLEIARSFRKGPRWSSAAIAMARHHSELEARMHAILDPHPSNGPQKLFAAAIAALTLWSITASAITFIPQRNNSLGGIFMKRTLLSGLLPSVGLSAATIGGSLFDPSGAAVSQAKASLYNPETTATAETTTTTDGKFAFENLPAGSYILRVEKPGFTSLFREFNVGADAKLERGLTLNAKENIAGGTDQSIVNDPADSQPLNPGQLRVKGELAEANLVKKVQPVYPVSAKQNRVQGVVSLDVAISQEGVPQEIRVVASPSDDLTQSALEAVRQWRYKPVLLNGQPVNVVTNVIVSYTLSY